MSYLDIWSFLLFPKAQSRFTKEITENFKLQYGTCVWANANMSRIIMCKRDAYLQRDSINRP
jgi:hypothetical protein